MSESEIGRRRWLRGLIPAATEVAAQVAGLAAEPPRPQRRPPGAIAEADFLAACTRCGECIEACPHGAVLFYNEKAGPRLAGTPIMRPDRRACHMCDGFPCAAACAEPALEVPAEPLAWLGVVRILPDRCMAYAGPECGACLRHCPDEAPAMQLIDWRPRVDERSCVGCGRCIHACPTRPRAIEMVPLGT
ncbi:MAG: 4Fe-4S binding protein [Myxococcales bacterium]|nr:4Fe-4S binding protein [Myxococcales bacterium]